MKQNIFKKLSTDEKNRVQKYYNAKVQELDKVQKLICREATIQVALQLTLILYQEILMKLPLLKKSFFFVFLRFIKIIQINKF